MSIFGGLLGGDSSKSQTDIYTTDNRIAATENAVVTRGQGALTAKDKAKVQRATGKGVTAQDKATVIQSTVGAGANTGLKFGNVSQGATITIGDGGAAATSLASTIANLTQDTTQSLRKVIESQGVVVQDALGKVTSLSESKQTDGESGRNRSLLWLAGLVIIGLLAYFIIRRS